MRRYIPILAALALTGCGPEVITADARHIVLKPPATMMASSQPAAAAPAAQEHCARHGRTARYVGGEQTAARDYAAVEFICE